MPDPLLEVSDLRVHFNTDDGVVRAVDGVSFSIMPGETLGVVGESGSGKSVSSLADHGPGQPQAGRHDRVDIVQGPGPPDPAERRDADIRGKQISMIFQDPMTSLHPFYRVGDQISEAILEHEDVSKKEASKRAVEMLGLVEHPAARGASPPVPARVLRRDAPAGHDRDGAVPQPRPAHRGRAHDRPRRHRAGADPGPDRQAEGRVRHGRHDHHPRPGRRRRVLRQHPGDVRRQDRGVREHRRHLLPAASPLHLGAAPIHPTPGRDRGSAHAHQGPAALAHQPAPGVLVRSSVPVPVRSMRRGGAARWFPPTDITPTHASSPSSRRTPSSASSWR